MVELRRDARLQARGDAPDLLQDAFLDAAARLDGYGWPGWNRTG
jgi:DNA-directed RNA polymerase specialized sigma24 family protein